MELTKEEILAPVEEQARLAIEARMELEWAIRRARSEGASLREIAKAAEMSHEQVRRLISQDQT